MGILIGFAILGLMAFGYWLGYRDGKDKVETDWLFARMDAATKNLCGRRVVPSSAGQKGKE